MFYSDAAVHEGIRFPRRPPTPILQSFCCLLPDLVSFFTTNTKSSSVLRLLRPRYILIGSSLRVCCQLLPGLQVNRQSQGTPTPDRSSSRQHHTFCTSRGLDHTVRGAKSGSWCQDTSRTPFLSGERTALQHPNIFIRPPDGVRDILRFSPESNAEAATGLLNVSKKWWDLLKRSILNHGSSSCALDPCAFVFVKQKIRCHWCFMWTTCWEEMTNCLIEPFVKVKREFDFGARDVEATRFKRRQLTQMANCEIMIDMEHYQHEGATCRSLEV